jgi:hypothetical protein
MLNKNQVIEHKRVDMNNQEANVGARTVVTQHKHNVKENLMSKKQ